MIWDLLVSELLIPAAIAVVFGFIGSALGEHLKGRPVAGFWMGLLFGPLGLLALMIFSDGRKKCHTCGEPMQAKWKSCPHCRQSPSTTVIERRPVATAYHAPMFSNVLCPWCETPASYEPALAGHDVPCFVCDKKFRMPDRPPRR